MKKEITLGQLLGVGVTLLITIVTGWVTINNKVSAHEIEIQALKAKSDRIEIKLDRIELKTQDILIILQNKKDR